MRVLITGSTSGIAYNLASKLSKRGHLVYATVKTFKEVETLKKKSKLDEVKLLIFKMDITNESDRKLIKKLEIDVLINHAGIGMGGSLLEMPISVLRKNYEINIFSSFQLLQDFYKCNKKTETKKKIFIMSSLAGQLPIPYLSCYTSSKAAISMIGRTMAKEIKYLNPMFSISVIEPGAYHTGFNQVMVDNKNINLFTDNRIYNNRETINRFQRNLFSLIEKEKTDDLVEEVIKQIESNNPKLIIRRPILQGIFTKILNIFIN